MFGFAQRDIDSDYKGKTNIIIKEPECREEDFKSRLSYRQAPVLFIQKIKCLHCKINNVESRCAVFVLKLLLLERKNILLFFIKTGSGNFVMSNL